MRTIKNLNNPHFPTGPWPLEGSLVFQIEQARQQVNQYSPASRLTVQPQIQLWADGYAGPHTLLSGAREPMNEEISVEAMIAISYGADAISWFWYPNTGSFII